MPPSPTCRRCRASGWRAATSTTTPPTDDARLVLTIARTAAARTARPSPTAAASSPSSRTPSGLVTGATVEADGRRIDVSATVVVNAAGVWADELRTLEDGHDADSIRPAKGIHITVPWEKVRNDIAVVIPVPRRQAQPVRRAVGRTPGRHVRAHLRRNDRHRLRRPARRPAVHGRRHRLRARRAQRTPITTRHHHRGRHGRVGRACGPLVKSATSGRTADLSRRHRVTTGPAGVIAITGGKLTTYREMAEDTVDAVLRRLGRKARGRTKRLQAARRRGLHERADGIAATAAPRRPLRHRSPPSVDGADRRRPRARRAARPRPAYLRAEAVYAARHEMATHARRRAGAPDPGPPLRPAGDAPGRAGASPRCWQPSSAGTTPRPPARSPPTASSWIAEEQADAMTSSLLRLRVMTEPTPPIELTGTRRPVAGHGRRRRRRPGRRAAGASLRSLTEAEQRRRAPAATGGRWRCTGRSPVRCQRGRRWSCRPTTTDRSPPIVRACDDRRHPAHRRRRAQRRVRRVGAGVRRGRPRHDRPGRARRRRRDVRRRRGAGRHVRARPRGRARSRSTA